MKQALAVVTIAVLLAVSQAASASDVTYSSPAAFDAATNALSTQTFGNVAASLGVGPGEGIGINNPLNSTTNTAMLPGLSISASTNYGDDLALLGPDFAGDGAPNASVFANYPGDLIFTFAPGDTAASLGLLSLLNNEDVTINVYDDNASLIGSFISPSDTAGAGIFWGITVYGDTVGSIDINASGEHAGVDQVQFGSAAAPTPEPGTLVLLSTGLAGMAAALRRKRTR